MAYLPSKAQIHAYKNNIDLTKMSRFVPSADEFERAEMYKQSDEIEKNLTSWSKFDKLKAYTDIKECVKLLEDELEGAAYNVLKRIELNLKVFDSEKKT